MAAEPFDPAFVQPSISSAICYIDPKRMYLWLEEAFGFEPYGIILDADGNLIHSQMTFGNGSIMVGNEWSDDHKSPRSVGGKNTQTVHLHLKDGIDAHCERARAAGAEILQKPELQFYGDRTYRARDPEGHIWTFSQPVKYVPASEWDADMGLSTITRLPE